MFILAMKMELVSRETIKPSAPTPPNLTIYPLSLIDNQVAPNSIPLVYFFPNQSPEEHDNNNRDQLLLGSKILALKKSLSKALSIYYPLAGRLKDRVSIHCNDQGVSFLLTQTKHNLSAFFNDQLEETSISLKSLFPDELQWEDMGSSSSLVAIQINCFACGGIAIGVCMSHKAGDVSVLFNFINDWALLNRNEDSTTEELLLTGGSASSSSSPPPFPQGDLPILPEFVFVKQSTVSRRLVFQGSKIQSLKAVVSNDKVENPTRVEVVVALIYKCAASALGLTNDNDAPLLRASCNLRKRMVPPLPEKSIVAGNLVWSFYASNDNKRETTTTTELHDSVSRTREGLSEFCDKYVKNFGDVSFAFEFMKQNASTSLPKKKLHAAPAATLFFASWRGFGAYEADFGWGNPMWVATCGCPVRNAIVLMDTRDGDGIEAVVNMEEGVMARFECDVELLQYASLNPNPWTC